MPIPTFCKECTHFQASEEIWAMCQETPISSCLLKDDVLPADCLDTPGALDCNTTFGRTALIPTSNFERFPIQHPDKLHFPANDMRTIINIQITMGSVIREHVSLYGTDATNLPSSADSERRFLKSVSDENSVSTPTSSPEILSSSYNVNGSEVYSMHGGGTDSAEESALRRALYSTDPVVYADICEPLAHWIADHIWKVTTQGLSLPLAFVGFSPCAGFPMDPLPVLAESINSLLMSTLLQPSAVILSLFYIAHLPAYIGSVPFRSLSSASASRFNKLLLSSDSIAQDGQIIQALYSSFKLFVLGAILSNKILDDHVFTMKTWHDVSGIPLKVLNELEWLSLDILSHELLLDSSTWGDWVHTLYSYHLSSLPPPSSESAKMSSYSVVRYMLEDLLPRSEIQAIASDVSSTQVHSPIFLGIQDRIASKQLDQKVQSDDPEGYELDDDGPLREEYLPKRRARDLFVDTSTSQATQICGGSYCGLESPTNDVRSWASNANAMAPSTQISTHFPNSSTHPTLACFNPVLGNDQYYPRVASTLCDYFLSYSRVRVC